MIRSFIIITIIITIIIIVIIIIIIIISLFVVLNIFCSDFCIRSGLYNPGFKFRLVAVPAISTIFTTSRGKTV